MIPENDLSDNEIPADKGCPVETPADESCLKARVLRFLEISEESAVTGVRRMGRDAFVEYVASVAREKGSKVSMFPDTDGDVVVFHTWEGRESEIQEVLSINPKAEVLYGQDLCHQVPAVVRYARE